MLILIAGLYRSGTNDNLKLMQQNLNSLESVALLLFRKGHIPMIGEWVALLLIQLAGSARPGDEAWEEILYPVAHRLLEKCDAVLRLSGASKGADGFQWQVSFRKNILQFKYKEITRIA